MYASKSIHTLSIHSFQRKIKGEMYMEKEVLFIDEQSYQQFKQEMCKTNDYFTVEEWKKLMEKVSVKLA